MSSNQTVIKLIVIQLKNYNFAANIYLKDIAFSVSLLCPTLVVYLDPWTNRKNEENQADCPGS